MTNNPYKILGVNRNASFEEIKKAYRQQIKKYHPDPTDKSKRFGMVSVAAVKALKNKVNLAQIKDHPKLNHLALVKQSRLSVMPIDKKSWTIICNLGGIK